MATRYSYPAVKVHLSAGRRYATSSKIPASLHLQSGAGASHETKRTISWNRNKCDQPADDSRTQSASLILKARSHHRNSRFPARTSVQRSLTTILPAKISCHTYCHFTQRQLAGRRLPFLRVRHKCLGSRSTIPKATLGDDLSSGSRGGAPDGGSSDVQNMLLEVLRIQLGKTRVTQFLDEKSEHLREIAHGSDKEFERIAERAMKRVDGLGNQVRSCIS